MNVILVKINQILMEKFLKLQDVPRTQVHPQNLYTHTHRDQAGPAALERRSVCRPQVHVDDAVVCLQLVWLVRELVKSGIMGADGVVMTLLKQIAGQT